MDYDRDHDEDGDDDYNDHDDYHDYHDHDNNDHEYFFIGILSFPAGWDNDEVRAICGEEV